MVLPDSDRVPRVPPYSGISHKGMHAFTYGAITRYGSTFQMIQLTYNTLWHSTHTVQVRPHNTTEATDVSLTLLWFGLFPVRSPLLRESLLISIPPGTEMFQFPGFASDCLCIQQPMTGVTTRRVSPFRHLRIKVRLATPRSLSQPSTSFFASKRLGIHRKPLFTYLSTFPSSVSPRARRPSKKLTLPLKNYSLKTLVRKPH